MRISTTLILLIFCSVNTVFAANMFETNNPFPQNVPQSMNNIYESEPTTIYNENSKKGKLKARNKKTKELEEMNTNPKTVIPVYPVRNDGTEQDGSFYMFTTGQ